MSRRIGRRATLLFEFGLASPPWMSLKVEMKYPVSLFSAIIILVASHVLGEPETKEKPQAVMMSPAAITRILK
jgi:hypothetical protein